jgi:hypothetical protein
VTTFDEVLQLGRAPQDDRWTQILDLGRSAWDRGGPQWAVLPSDEGFVAVSSGTEAGRRMFEVLRGFLGNMADVAGAPVHVESFGTEVLECRSVVVPNLQHPAMMAALQLMSFVRSRVPRIVNLQPLAVPVLLRDFHLAIAVGDAGLADRLLERLAESGGLSGENLRFLELQRDATFERWPEIAGAVDFADLCVMRRPLVISEILAEALWRRELSTINQTQGAAATRSRFTDLHLASKFESLLGSLSRPGRPLARLLVAVHYGCGKNAQRMAELTADLAPSETEQLWTLSGLESSGAVSVPAKTAPVVSPSLVDASPPAVPDLEHVAADLLDAGKYLELIDLYVANAGEVRVGVKALEAACELGVPGDAQRVLKAIAMAGVALPARVHVAAVHAAVQRLANGECADWLTWATRVVDEAWPAVNVVLTERSKFWPLEFLDDPVASSAVAGAMIAAADISNPNALGVRNAVGALAQLAVARPGAPGSSEIRSAVLMVLGEIDNASYAVRSAVLELLRSGFGGDWSPGQVSEALAVVRGLWHRTVAPHSVPWIVDILETLDTLPGLAAQAQLLALKAEVGASVAALAQQIDPVWFAELKEVLQGTYQFAASEQPNQIEGDREPWSRLDGLRIGFYSLDPGVQRIVDRVDQLVDGPPVKLVSAKVWTEAMGNLATSSDLLIVQIQRAAHAATGPISEHATGRVIWSKGLSPASLLRELEAFARSLVGSSGSAAT